MKFTNHEGVLHRDERLKKCARLTARIIGISEEQLGSLITSMHDTKGCLLVAWVHPPAKKAELAVEAAWQECGEQRVVHHIGEWAI
jgi:hypothetical protein